MNLTKNKLILYSFILGFLGFLDATYLTILHYKNALPPCSILHGCEKVLTGPFSMIGPFPLALFGVIFYLAVIGICLLILLENKNELVKIYHLVINAGFVISVVLFLIQALIIKNYCQFCILSEIISTGLLVLSFLKYKEDKKKIEN